MDFLSFFSFLRDEPEEGRGPAHAPAASPESAEKKSGPPPSDSTYPESCDNVHPGGDSSPPADIETAPDSTMSAPEPAAALPRRGLPPDTYEDDEEVPMEPRRPQGPTSPSSDAREPHRPKDDAVDGSGDGPDDDDDDNNGGTRCLDFVVMALLLTSFLAWMAVHMGSKAVATRGRDVASVAGIVIVLAVAVSLLGCVALAMAPAAAAAASGSTSSSSSVLRDKLCGSRSRLSRRRRREDTTKVGETNDGSAGSNADTGSVTSSSSSSSSSSSVSESVV